MAKSKKPRVPTERELNIIRGKNLVAKADQDDAWSLLAYIDKLELELDKRDCDDFFGTEGWRHAFGIPGAD